jgi:hypothetical protein
LGLATLREIVFAEVNLEQLQAEFGVEEKTAKMTGTLKNFRRNYDSEHSSGSYGNPIGDAHHNPVLDTRVYEVQFPDGRTEEVAANVIAQALYSQCDPDGNELVLLDSIFD